MKTEFWQNIKPKASYERLVDLYLQDSQNLKFACLVAIATLQNTHDNGVLYVSYNESRLCWFITSEPKHRGFVCHKNGDIYKIVSET